jgi:hypothetical protein
MGPHSEHVYDSLACVDSIDEPMLKTDPAGVVASQVSDELLKAWRSREGIVIKVRFGNELFATLIPKQNTITIAGDHDWSVKKRLWEEVLDRGVIGVQSNNRPGSSSIRSSKRICPPNRRSNTSMLTQ